MAVQRRGAHIVRAGVAGGDSSDADDGAARRAALRHPAVDLLAHARARRVDGRAAARAGPRPRR